MSKLGGPGEKQERDGGSPRTAETERTRSSSADRCVPGSPTIPKERPGVRLVEYYLSFSIDELFSAHVATAYSERILQGLGSPPWERSHDTKLTAQFAISNARQLVFPAPILEGHQPERYC